MRGADVSKGSVVLTPGRRSDMREVLEDAVEGGTEYRGESS